MGKRSERKRHSVARCSVVKAKEVESLITSVEGKREAARNRHTPVRLWEARKLLGHKSRQAAWSYG